MTIRKTLIIPAALSAVLLFSVCGRKGGGEQQAGAASTTAEESHTSRQSDKPQLCNAHGAPISACFICDASLRDTKRLWCNEHNRYEDRCFICHPKEQDRARLYCNEHGLYEDECFICHPASPVQSGGVREVPVDARICKEHDVPERECGICHPELLVSMHPGDGLKIRFESSQSAQKAGITTARPDSTRGSGGPSFPARTSFNENAMAVELARYPGVITSVNTDLGAMVKKGQVLATLSSAEFARIIAEFRSAENEKLVKETEYLREKELFEKKVSSRQDFDNAAALFNRTRNAAEALRQQLINAGIGSDDLTAILENNAVSSDFAIRAQVSGTITRRSAAVGQTVIAETPVMTIVDLSSLWITVAVPLSAGAKLTPGGLLRITFDQTTFYPAKIDWVSPEVDRPSGTVHVRAVVKNPGGTLKSGVFCRAFFGGDTDMRHYAISSEALANIDGNDVVFTRIEPDLYEIRRITLGGVVDGKAVILQGLNADDNVVVGGTFVVKSEFLKSRLGAGCVDD